MAAPLFKRDPVIETAAMQYLGMTPEAIKRRPVHALVDELERAQIDCEALRTMTNTTNTTSAVVETPVDAPKTPVSAPLSAYLFSPIKQSSEPAAVSDDEIVALETRLATLKECIDAMENDGDFTRQDIALMQLRYNQLNSNINTMRDIRERPQRRRQKIEQLLYNGIIDQTAYEQLMRSA
jgi:hypothetical protein